MDLWVWRHAEAEDAAPGESDLERELTRHGHEQARRIARWLHGLLPAELRIVCSPARRTLQTAQPLARAIETVEAVGPGASVAQVLDAIEWPRAKRPVLLVGHQPTLGHLISSLMCGEEQPWRVPKGSVWWLHSERGDGASLVAMRSPGQA
jgi:phosphohistidine phosphatase